jgi:type I restriction enzyme, R subunit
VSADATRQPSEVPSNFAFLVAEWPDLCSEATEAEQKAVTDPRASCLYARRTLELAVQWMYDAEEDLRTPYRRQLSAMLFAPGFRALVEQRIWTKMNLIRKECNTAVHENKPVSSDMATGVLRELFHVLFWVARTYSRTPEHLPQSGLRLDLLAIPQPVGVVPRQQTLAALRKREEEQAVQDAQLERARMDDPELQVELARLRAEVVQAKAANAARPYEHDYDEESTRDLYIDVMLKEAEWPLDGERDREFEVHGMPNKSGVGHVDYVLWGDDGRPLGVVEAKRARSEAEAGRAQAKLYADCLEQQFGQRPVIFYTNGYDTWLWDDERYPPRQVEGFYTKDELALLIQRRTARRSLADTEIRSLIVDRPYQHRAIRRVGKAFERDLQREALVVMATGAGKTRTVIALVDLLMRAGWVKRTLFLADRVALVNQAVGAFKAHLPDAGTINLVTEREEDGRVYVCTYPTMMGLLGGAAGERRRFGPGFFDLVIIDEAHRSVYQKYRAIFTYFDSLLVGLTATPREEVDRNTYELFNLEPGVPTDAYELHEAVEEGYLVPPRTVDVPLKFPIQGIRYADLPEAEREQWEEQDWGEEGHIPEAVAPEAVNRWLFNADTVDKVLEVLMGEGHKVAGGDRLGKTIIFAKNTAHADFIAKRFDTNYPEYRGHFAEVITSRTEYAQSLIDAFSGKDKAPHIAISVDMLDTGVDVPEVVNLVFFKTVRSRTKFWQMLGRGTRLCPNLYGPGENKRDFFVFDCCENVAFFNQQIEPAQGRPAASLGRSLFRERLELVMALEAAIGRGDTGGGERDLHEDTVARLRELVAGMNLDNFLVRPHRRWVERYRDADAWNGLDLEDAKELATHLVDLPSSVRDDDELAKRFDQIVLRLQLNRLRGEPGQAHLRHQVQEIATGLLEQTSIPAIKEQEALLHELAGDEWWVGVTVSMLEGARLRVRGLVRLLDRRKRAFVYTNFVDELGDVTEVELRGVATGTNFARFREKARAYLSTHESHVTLQKLRRNRQLTASDIAELERMLTAADLGDAADLDRARREAHGLGLFVRSLVGLERSAASDALASFIDGRNLGANQLDFLTLVVDHLTQNGVMDAGRLYDSPFTELAPQGPEGIFPKEDVDELVAAIQAVRARAEPSEEAA